MKKLLLAATLSAAGFISASTTKEIADNYFDKSTKKELSYNECNPHNINADKFYKLVYIPTPCGNDFYLNAEDYTNIYDYVRDIEYFTLIKCGYTYYSFAIN